MNALDPDAARHRVQEILEFCFGTVDDGLARPERRQRLFNGSRELDREIAEHFGDDVEAALAGGLEHWTLDAHGRLALVLLLDQFTRNAFRGTPRAYAGDDRALELAREGVSRGEDLMLPLEPRAFLYMPFEHSESLADQDTCLKLLTATREEAASDAAREVLDDYIAHAREHREIIARFGRFPHRNPVLDRPSTAAEREWLETRPRRFGQG